MAKAAQRSRVTCGVLSLIAALPAASTVYAEPPGAPPSPLTPPAPPKTVVTWDVNLEGALGHAFILDRLSGFGRVRAGVLIAGDPLFFEPALLFFGVTYEASNLLAATFGLQAEYLSRTTWLWGQLGPLVDTTPRPGLMAAVGWTLFGAEIQVRSDAREGAYVALYGKLRIPLGGIVWSLRQPPTVKPFPRQ